MNVHLRQRENANRGKNVPVRHNCRGNKHNYGHLNQDNGSWNGEGNHIQEEFNKQSLKNLIRTL
jgi:hypothetical protein